MSSTSADGTNNLTPYSFFNVGSVTPPIVMFTAGDRPDQAHGTSDTTRSNRANEEFIVNVVTEAMNQTMQVRSIADHHRPELLEIVGVRLRRVVMVIDPTFVVVHHDICFAGDVCVPRLELPDEVRFRVERVSWNTADVGSK